VEGGGQRSFQYIFCGVVPDGDRGTGMEIVFMLSIPKTVQLRTRVASVKTVMDYIEKRKPTEKKKGNRLTTILEMTWITPA